MPPCVSIRRKYLSLSGQATQRLCALAEAARLGLAPDRAAIRAQLEDLRHAARLPRQADLVAWAAANRLDEQALSRLLADQAKLAQLEATCRRHSASRSPIC